MKLQITKVYPFSAVIIYQSECWKTHPVWYPDNGFSITSEDRPWAGLICKHNHLTLVKNPVIDYTKSNGNGNAGRWYVKVSEGDNFLETHSYC